MSVCMFLASCISFNSPFFPARFAFFDARMDVALVNNKNAVYNHSEAFHRFQGFPILESGELFSRLCF